MTSKTRLKRKLDVKAAKKIQLWKITGYDCKSMNIAIECPNTGDRLMVCLLTGQEYDYNPNEYKDPPANKVNPDRYKADKEFYIEVIKSDKCFCGKNKGFGFPLCFSCGKGLDHNIKTALYKSISGDFKNVYENACKYLRAMI